MDSLLKVLRSFKFQEYGFGRRVVNYWKNGRLESRKVNQRLLRQLSWKVILMVQGWVEEVDV